MRITALALGFATLITVSAANAFRPMRIAYRNPPRGSSNPVGTGSQVPEVCRADCTLLIEFEKECKNVTSTEPRCQDKRISLCQNNAVTPCYECLKPVDNHTFDELYDNIERTFADRCKAEGHAIPGSHGVHHSVAVGSVVIVAAVAVLI